MEQLISAANASKLTPKTPGQKIIESIQAFEKNLGPNQEIAIKLGGFGQSITLFLESVQHLEGNMFSFHGTAPNGEPSVLIQHLSQLNFILATVPKDPVAEAPRRIQYLN